jgi:hypothetical protein
MSGSLLSVYTGSQVGSGAARAGIASLAIDGEVFDLAADGTYDATPLTRETMLGQSGVQGFSEMPKAGTIGGRIRDAGNMTVSQFKAKTNSTVVLRMANGKTVQGDGMWCTECSEVATQEATFTIKFEGTTVTEVPL